MTQIFYARKGVIFQNAQNDHIINFSGKYGARETQGGEGKDYCRQVLGVGCIGLNRSRVELGY